MQLVFISSFTESDGGGIDSFRLESDSGELVPVHRTTEVIQPYFMALSPDGRFLYSTHAPRGFGGEGHEQIAAFEITGQTGQLKLLNRQSALGSAACCLNLDDTGRTVLVSNYTSGSVASVPVRDDGSLGDTASMVQHTGSSVDASRQEGPHAHCMVVSPDNRFAFAADLGLDQVLSYRFDAIAAKLSPNRQPFVRTAPGAGPRHLTFHPGGQYVYVINELTSSVTLFDYMAESGMLIEQQTLSTLPASFDGRSHCADVKITPNGHFLYGTNRGHDSIAIYRIGDDGRLSFCGIEPSQGAGPQNMAITPGGELLLCANMAGENVVVFRIDPQTGSLSRAARPVSMPKPSCIMILERTAA